MLTQVDHKVSITGALDFSTVLDAWNQVSRLNWRKHISFDLSKVTEANSAALAFVIGLVRIGIQKKCTVSFEHLPESLVQLARVSGVDGFIQPA